MKGKRGSIINLRDLSLWNGRPIQLICKEYCDRCKEQSDFVECASETAPYHQVKSSQNAKRATSLRKTAHARRRTSAFAHRVETIPWAKPDACGGPPGGGDIRGYHWLSMCESSGNEIFYKDQSHLWVCRGEISVMSPTTALMAHSVFNKVPRKEGKGRLEDFNAPLSECMP